MTKRILLLGLLIVFSACTDFTAQENVESDTSEYPDQESWNATMYFTRDGLKRAILNAGYIAKYSNKKLTLLQQGVKVDFYDEKGVHSSTLTSKTAKVFDEREDMIANGNVIVVSDNGTHLYTEELTWDNKIQKIRSEVPVMITTESDTLYGDSFVSNPDLVDYEITNAHGTSKQTFKIDE